MRPNDIDWLLKTPIAHRGLHDGNRQVPENSLLSCSLAAAASYPIELDLHLLADGQIAVFHDDRLARMCGVEAHITRLTSTALSQFRLLHTGERIPLLEDVFDTVAGRVPLLLELKSSQQPGKLEPVLHRKLRSYKGLYAVQSFNPFHISWYTRHAPRIPRGQLAGDFTLENMPRFTRPALTRLMRFHSPAPDFIGYRSADLPNRHVASQRRLGCPVLAWTLRSLQEQDRLDGVCDNIVFEGFVPRMPGPSGR
jgi:glycerophosphoryl diester phosphodiesterase